MVKQSFKDHLHRHFSESEIADMKAEERAEQTPIIKPFNIYQFIEQDEIDTISFLTRDIALFVKILERWKKDGVISAYCKHFIRENELSIIESSERAEYARRQAESA